MKKNKVVKKIFNLYNLAILACIILIAGALFIIFKPEKKYTPSGIEVVNTGVKDDEEITEEQAKKVAVKQFKILNEDAKTEDLEIMKIQREGEEYYYISSRENTLEIKIKSGEITRINTAPVEE